MCLKGYVVNDDDTDVVECFSIGFFGRIALVEHWFTVEHLSTVCCITVSTDAFELNNVSVTIFTC